MSNNEKEQSTKDTSNRSVLPSKDTSMSTLIIWNVSKALEKNPQLKLRAALKAAQQRLENDTANVTEIVNQEPDQRHLSCALLAWQQLGHNDSDSLYRYVENKLKKVNAGRITHATNEETSGPFVAYKDSSYSDYTKDSIYSAVPPLSMGPVLKLPVDPRIVMRVDNTQSNSTPMDRVQKAGKDLKAKIEEACCLESGCMERLAQLDAHTKELRDRLAKLARREAERVELLERAETAWRDLEMGYMRRLNAVTEKEEDMNRYIDKMVKERTINKEECGKLVEKLKPQGDSAEKVKEKQKLLEADVCARACERLRLSELSAQADADLANVQCKATQLERDLQFKEEQKSRKLQNMQSELESQRGLTFEAERAMRAELGGLKEQIKDISLGLTAEDDAIAAIKQEILDLQKEKAEIIEDLEGCQEVCDKGMQKKADELKKKKETLQTLKNKVLDCKCKIPIEVGVTAKRTPSLAALCQCLPEERYLESCSCTSLRTRLLSDLLSDLFSGLQSELNTNGTKMPCTLLKCLEDRHNWDRASVVRTNLRNFFAKMLIGELDIAIATSIENYHAKWVGQSCVDISSSRPIPHYDPAQHEGWERRAFDKQTQKLASQLAEQMFQDRAEELVQRAKQVMREGPPPCDCKPPKTSASESKETAAFPLLLGQPAVFSRAKIPAASPLTKPSRRNETSSNNQAQHSSWQRTISDVLELRDQIADLRRESIKKEDLRVMERKITKIVQQASSPENRDGSNSRNVNKIGSKNQKTIDTDSTKIKRTNNSIKKNIYPEPNKSKGKVGNKQHIVNWCLCGIHKSPSKTSKGRRDNIETPNECKSWNQKYSKETVCQISSSIKQTKPIQELLTRVEGKFSDDESLKKPTCGSDCACFNKVPSCSSIDKLLETLTRWKFDLNNVNEDETKINDILSEANKLKIPINEIMAPPKSLNMNSNEIAKYFFNSGEESKTDTLDSGKIVTGIGQTCAPTTESEYMGAINLEKSNENFCKCVTFHNKNDTKTNVTNVNSQYKCIRSCKCGTNSREVKSVGIEAQLINKEAEKIEFNTKKDDQTSFNNIKNDQGFDLPEKHCEENNRSPTTSNLNKPSVTCNCDYEIKFLGVTLDNSTSEKIIVNTSDNSSQLENITPPLPLENEYARSKQLVIPVSHATETLEISKSKISNKHGSLFKLPAHQCSLKIDDLKDFFDNARKEMGDINEKVTINTNYEINTPEEKKERCICCVNSFTEETNDLEVNTFLLLEEHLKKRLNELKNNCIATCIRPEDENELFTTIFKKIKRAIMDCTNKILCKCADEANTEGSWQRVQTLLQEYIKMKIKRIQCSCISSNQNKMILPDLTDKVCLLIENDFQRLRDICKCKNSERSMLKNKNIIIDGAKFLTAEKDFSNISNKETFIKEIMAKADIITQNMSAQIVPDIITQNMSSQIIPDIATQNISAQIIPDIETKSCEAVTKNDYRTVDTQNTNSNNLEDCIYCGRCKKQEAINKKSVDVITDYNALLSEVLGTSPDFNKTMELNKESDKVLSSPLTGCTVNCSCVNKIGTCVCSKSMVLDQKASAGKIWQKYSSRPPCKLDYIMKNTKKKCGSSVEFSTNTKVPTATKMCNMKTSVHDVSGNDEIVLKDSSQNFNISPVNHYTNTITTTPDEVEVLSSATGGTDDRQDWFECNSQIGYEPPKTKSVHFRSNHENILLSSVHRAKSELIGEEISKLTTLLNQGCECSLVPICHVKMLMEDIEDKLVHSKCTCDSLNSTVCPVHAVRMT